MVVADAVAARIDAIKAANPDTDIADRRSVTCTLGNYESPYTLYEGAALAVLVVFLFLRDIRATFIAAITCRCRSCPRSGPWTWPFSLNVVSLLASP
jgi:multidrug efflux pump subunit AcrB